MGYLDIPQKITLIHYSHDFMLIRQDEQEMTRALEALVRYLHSRRWEINSLKIQWCQSCSIGSYTEKKDGLILLQTYLSYCHFWMPNLPSVLNPHYSTVLPGDQQVTWRQFDYFGSVVSWKDWQFVLTEKNTDFKCEFVLPAHRSPAKAVVQSLTESLIQTWKPTQHSKGNWPSSAGGASDALT